MIKVLFFGKLAETTGKNEKSVPFFNNLAALLDALHAEYPEIGKSHYSIAVNHKICNDRKRELMVNDTVALLPPFSGG